MMILRNVLSDFFSPVLYKIEQNVASRSIPSLPDLAATATAPRKTLEEAAQISGGTFDHSLWNGLLHDYVVCPSSPEDTVHTIGAEQIRGVNLVDYDGLGEDSRFAEYLDLLAKAEDPSATLSGLEQVAFWMNAYNACCCNLIVQKQPESSINQLSSTEDGAVWNQYVGTNLAGKRMSLNDIEHNQLRKEWAIPQVHACIVCASASCPNLRPEAFRGDILQNQMKEQMLDWMGNESKGFQLQQDSERAVLSRIYLWFAKDFGTDEEALRNFAAPYVSTNDQESLRSMPLRYFTYDWTLNKLPKDTQA